MVVLQAMHVVITGASSGIGEALARAWFARGASVTLVARRKALLEKLAAESKSPTHVVEADLSQVERVTDWVAEAEAKLGPIDVLVNNAGVQIIDRFPRTEWAAAKKMMDLDLYAPLRLTHHVVQGMIARGHGTLVDVSSMAGIAPTPFMSFYNAAKAGLAAASESLRAELKPYGVHVLTVYPGPVHTPLGDAGAGKYQPSWAMKVFAPLGHAHVLAPMVLRAVDRKKARVIYPWINVLARYLPTLTRWLLDAFTPPLRD
jgi:short-subunit dehydrogenase